LHAGTAGLTLWSFRLSQRLGYAALAPGRFKGFWKD
jgi:hypothetical protein